MATIKLQHKVMILSHYFTNRIVVAFLIASSIWGCSKKTLDSAKGENGGTLVISTAADADYLFPPLVATTQGRAVTELLFDHLAEVGDELNVIGDEGFQPKLAEEWKWGDDSLTLTFKLDKAARWHDGIPVSAEDVQFTFQTYSAPQLASPSAPLLSNIDSVTVRDSLTAVFWLRENLPTSFFDAASQMLILPKHVYGEIPLSELVASTVIRNPIGSGRFKFRRWTPGTTIEIITDVENYRGRAKLDRVIWTISPDFNAAGTRLLTGAADFYEAMNRDLIDQIQGSDKIKVLTYPGFDYGFLMFNLKDPKNSAAPHPLFGNAALRRALAMAVNREAVVASIFDTLAFVSTGPMLRAMPTTDTTLKQIPYDTAQARQTLDSLGWRLNSKGIRERNGRELAFTLIAPTSSRNRVQAAVMIQEQLKRLGVAVRLQQLESNTFHRRESSREFDAAMHAWHLDASPANIVQTWGTEAAAGESGSNYSSYSNPVFDAQVDSALRSSTLDEAKQYFSKAYKTIITDAPAIWIYELKGAIGFHSRINVTAIRPDAWWTHLADWWIPADKRIERDRIPPAAN